jgi:hypothetical protein
MVTIKIGFNLTAVIAGLACITLHYSLPP